MKLGALCGGPLGLNPRAGVSAMLGLNVGRQLLRLAEDFHEDRSGWLGRKAALVPNLASGINLPTPNA